MNNTEMKLTEYLHNIIEENISLRKQNDILWKQKLDYIGAISDAIECIKSELMCYDNESDEYKVGNALIEILQGDKCRGR